MEERILILKRCLKINWNRIESSQYKRGSINVPASIFHTEKKWLSLMNLGWWAALSFAPPLQMLQASDILGPPNPLLVLYPPQQASLPHPNSQQNHLILGSWLLTIVCVKLHVCARSELIECLPKVCWWDVCDSGLMVPWLQYSKSVSSWTFWFSRLRKGLGICI